MPRISGGDMYVWKQQADAVLTQASPVSGTKYTILDTTKNCKIRSIQVKVTWTVQPTPLEAHMTIDGIAFKLTQANPVSTTHYFATIHSHAAATSLLLTTVDYASQINVPLTEGKSVKIELEITGGTVSELAGRVKYAKKVAA